MRRFAVAFITLACLEFAMVRPVNAAAVAIAESSEGCVLHVYKDPKGVPTAGYGHSLAGTSWEVGQLITQAQADAWKAADMARAAAFVEAHVEVKLSDNQFSALAEFAFNIGVGAFLGSTLLRTLNKGNYTAVPGQLMRWTTIRTATGKKTLPGLVTRRAAEVALWNTPDPGVPESAPQAVVAANDEPHINKPSPPSLLERIRAWLNRNPEEPA